MPEIPCVGSYDLPLPDDLPNNVVTWPVGPERMVLLVHDMQNFFLRPLPEPLRSRLVDNVVDLREKCREAGVPVAYTAQPGGMTAAQRGLLKDFWGPGMTVDPVDRDVAAALAPGPDDPTFTKWRYSAFFGSRLLDWMREHGRDQLMVCGVYGHVGVLMTAVDAFTNDIQPFVVADAIADFSAEHHDMTLRYAAARCAAVTSVKQVLE